MNKKDLLIEIGTEELPPKALKELAIAFADQIHNGLEKNNLLHKSYYWFATPRRLAVIVERLIAQQKDQEITRRGPAVAAAYDADGNPTKAALGFAGSCGVEVSELETEESDKGSWLAFRSVEKGQATSELLPDIITSALASLPIPKRMRWADSDAQFVRPVHWSIVILGRDIVPCELLGTQSSNESRGHRFHYPKPLKITSPASYLKKLKDKAYVIADFEERKELIRSMVTDAGEKLGGKAHIEDALLEEVTSLVEWPVVITGSFEQKFLKLPKEVLISSMQDHQKYFAVTNDSGQQLLNHFITIANLDSTDPDEIRRGNEKVIRPRLSDAEFFWQRDCRQPLIDFAEAQKEVIFQKQLGTLADKTERVKKLSAEIAVKLKANKEFAVRAATLAKCDLFTEMVGEFPELQGIMGRYYAIESNEAEEIAQALDEQYMPRFAGDELPACETGKILAIADKLDTLVGLFGIGQQPTGTKDPFALRRATLGIIRILIENKIEISLHDLVNLAFEVYDKKISDAHTDVETFIFDRLAGHMKSLGYSTVEVDSVLCLRPDTLYRVPEQLEAVRAFSALTEAESLVAANKRVDNILKQAASKGESFTHVDFDKLKEPVEQQLYTTLQDTSERALVLFEQGDFAEYLKSFAVLKEPVDLFFDTIMVMAEDPEIRANRLALLADLRKAMNKVADISRLQS